MKDAKKFLAKITSQKITEKKAHELLSDLITPDIPALEKLKNKDKDRRNSILNVLKKFRISVYWCLFILL